MRVPVVGDCGGEVDADVISDAAGDGDAAVEPDTSSGRTTSGSTSGSDGNGVEDADGYAHDAGAETSAASRCSMNRDTTGALLSFGGLLISRISRTQGSSRTSMIVWLGICWGRVGWLMDQTDAYRRQRSRAVRI